METKLLYTKLFVEGVATRRGGQVGTSAVAGFGTTFAGKTTWISSVSLVISMTSRYLKSTFIPCLGVRILGLPSLKNEKVVENSSSTTHLFREFLTIDQVLEVCKHFATWLENHCAMVVFKLRLSNGIWRVSLQRPRCSISVAVVKWRDWTKHNKTKWASWQEVVEIWFYLILSVSGQIFQDAVTIMPVGFFTG